MLKSFEEEIAVSLPEEVRKGVYTVTAVDKTGLKHSQKKVKPRRGCACNF